MKKISILICFLFFFISPPFVSSQDTLIVNVADYGILPDSEEDVTPKIISILDEIPTYSQPIQLTFKKGTYHFYKYHSSKAFYAITAVHQMWDFYTPFHLDKLSNITIDAGGALFMMHGRMTPFVINECNNIAIRNVKIDQEYPSIYEIKVLQRGRDFTDFEVHKDSRYVIENGSIKWLDADGNVEKDPNVWCKYNSQTSTIRRQGSILKHARTVSELGEGIIRVSYDQKKMPDLKIDDVFQFRWHIRDQQGAVINKSQGVTFKDVELYTTNGLGVVSQLSGDLTFNGFQLKPRPGSGRTAAGFADALHLYGTTGKIQVENCRFVGMHDDGINIYNYYLKVEKTVQPNSLVLKFPCWEQCGFDPYFIGDSVLFRKSDNLVKLGSNIIVKSELIDKETVQVWLKEEVTKDMAGAFIENITQIPDFVHIKNNHFERIATRGILMYTARKSVIENNFFHRTPMPAVLLKNPDDQYYLQGYTKDLTIRNNIFYECLGHDGGYDGPGEGVIHFKPQLKNAAKDFYLYENVNISNNVFILKERSVPMVKARRVSGLTISGNIVESVKADIQLIDVENCDKMIIENNKVLYSQ